MITKECKLVSCSIVGEVVGAAFVIFSWCQKTDRHAFPWRKSYPHIITQLDATGSDFNSLVS